ncbi:MAG: HEAT repeat domain-containing protein [Planctomycetota bacterium]|jgi:hypothetical protein
MPIGEDLSTWRHWWDFNQDRFLPFESGKVAQTGSDDFYLGATRTRSASAASVDANRVHDEVLPALRRAIEAGPSDVTANGLIALARVGVDHRDWRITDVIAARLGDGDQRVRETAALALGLAGHTDGRRRMQLIAVLRDDAGGRALVGHAVSDRTRSFAAYGLGLLASRTDKNATKRAVFEALADVLLDETVVARDVRVAALQAIGLLDIDRKSYRGARLTQEVLATLETFFAADRGVGEQQVQAHCPTAIARMLDRDDPGAERHKERFAAILEGKGLDGRKTRRRVQHAVAQSCALALGQLVRPNEDGDASKDRDVRFSEVLRATWKSHKDAQTRSFAVLALGQIGGADNREFLLKAVDRASRNLEQPWCALALGLCAEQRQQRTGAVDTFAAETLMRCFDRAKNPEAVGAFAIALGLAGCDASRGKLAKALPRNVGKDVAPGAICQALSMLDANASQVELRKALDKCDRRPELYEEATRALGRLGDAEIAEALLQRLVRGEANYEMQLALATALSDVGGAAQVAPLVEVVRDASRSAVTRAGAARALGGIVDRKPIRWNTLLRENANYRAAVATLTDGNRGVLDLR